MWSVGDEHESLTAWGMKLLHSLLVRQWILLYPSPDGSGVNGPLITESCFFQLTSIGFSLSINGVKNKTSLRVVGWRAAVVSCYSSSSTLCIIIFSHKTVIHAHTKSDTSCFDCSLSLLSPSSSIFGAVFLNLATSLPVPLRHSRRAHHL